MHFNPNSDEVYDLTQMHEKCIIVNSQVYDKRSGLEFSAKVRAYSRGEQVEAGFNLRPLPAFLWTRYLCWRLNLNLRIREDAQYLSGN